MSPIQQLNYIGNPVLSLQTMLRAISFEYECIPRLIPDGVFGERTLEAVMVFQREFFPPVTGQVDNDTWDAIAVAYQRVTRHLARPLPCRGYPSRGYTVSPGQSSVHLYLVQAMFKSLACILEEVEPCAVTGVHDGTSVRNTIWLQRLGQMEETGVLDKDGWDLLSRLYTIFVAHVQTPWLTRPELLATPR